MMANPRLSYLMRRWFNNELAESEQDEFITLLNAAEAEEDAYRVMEELWAERPGGAGVFERAKSNEILNAILQTAPVININRNKFSFRKFAVAASILIAIGIGSYFTFFKKSNIPINIAAKPTNDVQAPKVNRAMITLANGDKIFLDSAANGTLAKQGTVSINKLADGKISYIGEGNGTSPLGEAEVRYNTLTNPRGSRVIDITLSDGSRVWLNAESTITYPTAFNGNERKVQITGEAYFEVTHDKTKPFIVSKGDMNVTVLGTHFNVNAYDDEKDIRVTLLEGSVKVSNSSSPLGEAGVRLKPGEQAILTTGNTRLTTDNSVDLESIMAWKNGKFSFNRADIKTVMRQLARWYDLDVEYKTTSTDLFGGDIQRDLPLSNVLDFLRKSKVNFEVDRKKVIVQ